MSRPLDRDVIERLRAEYCRAWEAIPRHPDGRFVEEAPEMEEAQRAFRALQEAMDEFHEAERRELEQRSAAEVPGFHARTVIDDTIGKLWALRKQLRTEIPDEVPGLLDDVEELVERLVDIVFDPDAPEVGDGFKVGEDVLMSSKSGAVCWCSCGGPCL